MRVRTGEEQAFAQFRSEQSATAEGRTMLEFMDTWSAMMECVLDHGAEDTHEVANVTMYAAADAAGVTTDDVVVEGGYDLLRFWAHGEGLEEWLRFRPDEELLDQQYSNLMDVENGPQELRDALPVVIEEYPGILQSEPQILDYCGMLSEEGQSAFTPGTSPARRPPLICRPRWYLSCGVRSKLPRTASAVCCSSWRWRWT